MVSEKFQSPNAIPPRISSSNITSSFLTPPTPTRTISPTKPVLTPVPEGDWIAQRNRMHASNFTTQTSYVDMSDSMNGVASTVSGQTWSAEKEKILLGPFDYMYDKPGKNIRRQLIAAFNVCLKVPEGSLAIITEVVGMLHTASLLVDDVEDSSMLRRGIPVAHNIFGTAQTINSANYVYFQALQEIFKLNNPKAIQIYTEELINLHRGQGMDLFWRDSLTCPTEEDYIEMIGNKTGGLFRLAIKLMQAESSSYKDYVPLVNIIGTLFQIRDDYQNLSSTEYTDNKGLCEDLTEGKFSYPIIHAIRANPQNLQLLNILKQKTKNEEIKKYAVNYMQDMGSFDYTKKTLKDLKSKAVAMIESLDESDIAVTGLRIILDKLDVV